MSQLMTEPAAAREPAPSVDPVRLEQPSEMHGAGVNTPEMFDEFDYHPVPPLAPIALFLGVCSVVGLMGVPGLAVGLIGSLVGLIAMWQIARSSGELGGRTLARVGFALSSVLFVAGAGYHTYDYITELPEGYERVSFSWLSKFEPFFEDGKVGVPAEVENLEGRNVFIKGYMYPTRQKTGITEFVLVKDTGQCCFGGQPKITDMIIVRFKNGVTAEHRELQQVGVAGVFHAKQVMQAGELTAIYSLEGTHFK
jgi:hypothetical protein